MHVLWQFSGLISLLINDHTLPLIRSNCCLWSVSIIVAGHPSCIAWLLLHHSSLNWRINIFVLVSSNWNLILDQNFFQSVGQIVVVKYYLAWSPCEECRSSSLVWWNYRSRFVIFGRTPLLAENWWICARTQIQLGSVDSPVYRCFRIRSVWTIDLVLAIFYWVILMLKKKFPFQKV